MSISEQQFPELISHLIVSCNNALEKSNSLPAMGLTLKGEDQVETVLGVSEENDLREDLNLIQNGLKEKALAGEIDACCISYPDYDKGVVVAFLENRENYCSKILIPVDTRSVPVLDPSGIEEHVGTIYVFPEYVDS